MRFLIFFLLLVTTDYVSASSPVASPRTEVLIRLENRRGMAWRRIFREEAHWACQSEHLPFKEIQTDPFASVNWRKLDAESIPTTRKSSICSEKVTLIDRRQDREKSFTGCSKSPEFHKLIRAMDRACGLF